VVFVFDAQPLQRVGLGGFAFADLVQPGEGGQVGLEPGLAFFFFHGAVVLDAEPADEQRQAQALHDERGQNHDEGEEQDQIAAGKGRAIGRAVQGERDGQRRRE
jgi:hypothetical protein